MTKKTEGLKIACTNKKARRDYHIEDTVEAGLVLWGNEVKSLREARATLTDSYARFSNGEVWLSGLHISTYKHAPAGGQDPDRERKLLLKAIEIKKLSIKVEQRGYTLVPLRIYFKRGYAKVELGLGTGKKNYDKRHDLKRKDAQREMDRAVKDRL
jgi:SsrA-binding protein